jgi:hypothetical protein
VPVQTKADLDYTGEVHAHASTEYPGQIGLLGPMRTADQVRIFRVMPSVISVLGYSKGFGHTDSRYLLKPDPGR